MHHDYRDITERIETPPTWWDENGCPRWGRFAPDMVPDIYADEVCLLEIECQGCGRLFQVAMSLSATRRMRQRWLRRGAQASLEPAQRSYDETDVAMSLVEQVARKFIHYGDPPNHVVEDHAGSTMNSIPRRVIEFWDRTNAARDWKRVPAAEIAISEGDDE